MYLHPPCYNADFNIIKVISLEQEKKVEEYLLAKFEKKMM